MGAQKQVVVRRALGLAVEAVQLDARIQADAAGIALGQAGDLAAIGLLQRRGKKHLRVAILHGMVGKPQRAKAQRQRGLDHLAGRVAPSEKVVCVCGLEEMITRRPPLLLRAYHNSTENPPNRGTFG